jgi:hypothetical protein
MTGYCLVTDIFKKLLLWINLICLICHKEMRQNE